VSITELEDNLWQTYGPLPKRYPLPCSQISKHRTSKTPDLSRVWTRSVTTHA